MTKIIRVNGIKKYGANKEWAILSVELSHGQEAFVWVGGTVEEYASKFGIPMARVRRNKALDSESTTR